MGQKSIKLIDLSQPEEKKPKVKRPVKTEKAQKPQEGRKIAKSGKGTGRITDMAQVALEETEKLSQKEKVSQPKATTQTAKKTKKTAPSRVHSHRFAALRKMVKSGQLYSPKEAVDLLKKMANAGFDETVELHLVSFDKGVLGKAVLPQKIGKEEKLVIKTEKKAPLAHLVIAKTSWTQEKILGNLTAILESLNLPKIRKIILKSTMSPAIKVAFKTEK